MTSRDPFQDTAEFRVATTGHHHASEYEHLFRSIFDPTDRRLSVWSSKLGRTHLFYLHHDRDAFATLRDSHLFADRLSIQVRTSTNAFEQTTELGNIRKELEEARHLLAVYRRLFPAVPSAPTDVETNLQNDLLARTKQLIADLFGTDSPIRVQFLQASGFERSRVEAVIRLPDRMGPDDVAERMRALYDRFEDVLPSEIASVVDLGVDWI